MNLMPSTERLHLGLRKALHVAASHCTDPRAAQAIGSAQVILDELTLRSDHAFYFEYAMTGRKLLAEIANALSPSKGKIDYELISKTLDIRLAPDLGFSVIGAHIEALRACFVYLIKNVLPEHAEQRGHIIQRALQWEDLLFDRALNFQVPTPAPAREALTAEHLHSYLLLRFPERDALKIIQFKPLIGGFQKLTVLFTTEDRQMGKQALVLRGEQPDRFIKLDLGEIPDEYALVELAHDAGLPVAEPLWVELDPSLLGFRFMVSREVQGTNYGTAVGAEKGMDEVVARSLVNTLVQLNSVSLEKFEKRIRDLKIGHWVNFPSLRENTLANVDYWYDQLQLFPCPSSPTIEFVYRWLMANAPVEDTSPCLLHCDYAAHNVLVKDGVVTGILDWESARIGDPAEDLAYFLRSAAAQLERNQAIEWYEAAGGPRISEFRLRYFEVMCAWRVMIACHLAAGIYEHDERARNEWLLLALKWMHIGTGAALPTIKAAESARV